MFLSPTERLLRRGLTVVQEKWTISVSWLAVARKETVDDGQTLENHVYICPYDIICALDG